jgi:hypothetical protein
VIPPRRRLSPPDDWFDAIEDGVRAPVRGFIETMLEEELSEALSRPRYGRRRPEEDEATPSVVGVRHGHRERTPRGTFGKTRIAVPRARLTGEDGKTREWRSGSLLAYQRRTRAFSLGDMLIVAPYADRRHQFPSVHSCVGRSGSGVHWPPAAPTAAPANGIRKSQPTSMPQKAPATAPPAVGCMIRLSLTRPF